MRTFSLLQDTSWIAMDMDSEFKLGFYGPLCTNLLASLGQALAWIFQRKFGECCQNLFMICMHCIGWFGKEPTSV